MNAKVMLVDDEPSVLNGYRRNLRRSHDLATATSGAEALRLAEEQGPFAVVVADMRMPAMDGIELLERLKELAPDTIRIMLTGNSDQRTAMDAVNKGDVFRFLTKPCTPEELAGALDRGIEQHRLLIAEKQLLEETLKGAILALSDVLAVARPDLFGRLGRLGADLRACAGSLELEFDWALEALPVLALIGTVALPDELVAKGLSGRPMTPEERAQFERHPVVGAAILERIPRLEGIAAQVRQQLADPNCERVPLAARLLRVVLACDGLEQQGLDTQEAISRLASEPERFDARCVEALRLTRRAAAATRARRVEVLQLDENMELAEDVLTRSGSLLIVRGQRITRSVAERLMCFAERGAIEKTVLVRDRIRS